MFERILVGYDGSEPAHRALLAAFELAHCYKGQVLALAVVRPPEFAELEGEIQATLKEDKGLLAESFQWARREAEKAGINLQIRTQLGHPAETLMRGTEGEGFDLIVLGRRGLTPVQYWVLGSVSERVLRYAHCPVMVLQ